MLFRAAVFAGLVSISIAQDSSDIAPFLKNITEVLKHDKVYGFNCEQASPMCCEWLPQITPSHDDDDFDREFSWKEKITLEANCVPAWHGPVSPFPDDPRFVALEWFCILPDTKKICCDPTPIVAAPSMGMTLNQCYPSSTYHMEVDPTDKDPEDNDSGH